jgi:hypothetical protein
MLLVANNVYIKVSDIEITIPIKPEDRYKYGAYFLTYDTDVKTKDMNIKAKIEYCIYLFTPR